MRIADICRLRIEDPRAGLRIEDEPKVDRGAKGGPKVGGPARAAARPLSFAEALLNEVEPGFNTPCAGGAADLWAAAAAADPSWDRMSGERESRGTTC